MYMLLLCDTEPKSRVLTLVDVYTASTQCLKLLCDQFGLQPQNSSPLICCLRRAIPETVTWLNLPDIVGRGCTNIVGVWRLVPPSPNMSQISNCLKVNYKLVQMIF